MSAIDNLLVELDGTVDEVKDVKNVSIPMDFNLRVKIEALSQATDKSKSFIMRGLIDAALDELIPKLDEKLKRRYADLMQDIHVKRGV